MSTDAKPKLSNAEFITHMRGSLTAHRMGNGVDAGELIEALDRLEESDLKCMENKCRLERAFEWSAELEAENAQKDLLLTFGTEQMARAHADFARLKAENAELRAAVAELQDALYDREPINQVSIAKTAPDLLTRKRDEAWAKLQAKEPEVPHE